MCPVGDDRAELEAFYARYLQRCNEHRFSELAEFVTDDVEVNDGAMGVAGYGEGLQTVVDTFPDFHWELRHLLVEDGWLSARLVDTGSTRDGRSITLQEFAMYRIENGKIAAVWGDLEARRLTPPR
jgi:predicted ester cyclase